MSDNTPTNKQHEESESNLNKETATEREENIIETSNDVENDSDTIKEKFKGKHEEAHHEEEEEEVQSSDDIEEKDEEEEDKVEKEYDYSDLSEKQLLSTLRNLVNNKEIPTIRDASHPSRAEYNTPL